MPSREQRTDQPVPDTDERSDPMAGRRPWIRVDSADLREDPKQAGAYEVRIRGHNLRMAISPPRIEIGGVALRYLSFDPDGTEIRGTLERKPESDQVIVDFGYARGETRFTALDDAERKPSQ
jgi:hypothetical protein